MQDKQRHHEHQPIQPSDCPTPDGGEDLAQFRQQAQNVGDKAREKMKGLIEPSQSAAINQASRQINGQ